MRNLIMIALLLTLASCTRWVTCSEPGISLEYKYDSTGIIYYTTKCYSPGSNFSKLISSSSDTALSPKQYSTNSLKGTYDWVIEIPETGKTYKISKISYTGSEKETDGTALTEVRKRSCSRTIHFTLNEKEYSSGYDYSITITK